MKCQGPTVPVEIRPEGRRKPATLLGLTLYDELRNVLRALDEDGVEHALIGALAVAVWGAPRATKDIDLLIRGDDLARALESVARVGFTLRALPMTFKDGTEVQRVNKVDADGQDLDR